MIESLHLKNVGPLPELELSFGSRLNLLTGDNGLGKSFILDVVWWALTRHWPAVVNPTLTSGMTALPTIKTSKAAINAAFSTSSSHVTLNSSFNSDRQSWTIPKGRKPVPGFVFYAMSDGSFAVWDPARNYSPGQVDGYIPPAYVFNAKQVWDGLQAPDGTWVCNGLIRDLASWMSMKDTHPLEMFERLLAHLSSGPGELIELSGLSRISLWDTRDMPMLKMPYGEDVPVVHASSGIRRIISLAYFLVWSWLEHEKVQKLLGKKPESRALFLIDEVESHLHPKWQRIIIPALLEVMNTLSKMSGGHGVEVQMITATHSPLVMSSVESLFDDKTDKWFDLDLVDHHIVASEREYERMGSVDRWLESEAFDMQTSYSKDAEEAIKAARALGLNSTCTNEQIKKVHQQLVKVLPELDPFWIVWNYFREQRGIAA